MSSSTLRGFCRRCGVDHAWDNDVDVAAAALRAWFAAASDTDRALLAASPGKMVGVLVVDDAAGHRHVLRGFSGDLGGAEDQPGWVPSVVRRADTAALQEQTWATVRRVDAALAALSTSSSSQSSSSSAAALRQERRAASQTLMAAMHAATRLVSRGGISLSLPEIVGSTALPSGMGDCVLPKVFEAAHRGGLVPVGFAEAWWSNDVDDPRHGRLEAPCAARCAPLIGHLLCKVPVR
jgi:hypothetical protein